MSKKQNRVMGAPRATQLTPSVVDVDETLVQDTDTVVDVVTVADQSDEVVAEETTDGVQVDDTVTQDESATVGEDIATQDESTVVDENVAVQDEPVVADVVDVVQADAPVAAEPVVVAAVSEPPVTSDTNEPVQDAVSEETPVVEETPRFTTLIKNLEQINSPEELDTHRYEVSDKTLGRGIRKTMERLAVLATKPQDGDTATLQRKEETYLVRLCTAARHRIGDVGTYWSTKELADYLVEGKEPDVLPFGTLKSDTRLVPALDFFALSKLSTNFVKDYWLTYKDQASLTVLVRRLAKGQEPVVLFDSPESLIEVWVRTGEAPAYVETVPVTPVVSVRRQGLTAPNQWYDREIKLFVLGLVKNDSKVPDADLRRYAGSLLVNEAGVVWDELVNYVRNGVAIPRTSLGCLVTDTLRDSTPPVTWTPEELVGVATGEIKSTLDKAVLISAMKEVFSMSSISDSNVYEEVAKTETALVSPNMTLVDDALKAFVKEMGDARDTIKAGAAHDNLNRMLRKLINMDFPDFAKGYGQILREAGRLQATVFNERNLFYGMSQVSLNPQAAAAHEQLLFLILSSAGNLQDRKTVWAGYNRDYLFEKLSNSRAQENLVQFYEMA
jgi:hypothetical protein